MVFYNYVANLMVDGKHMNLYGIELDKMMMIVHTFYLIHKQMHF